MYLTCQFVNKVGTGGREEITHFLFRLSPQCSDLPPFIYHLQEFFVHDSSI